MPDCPNRCGAMVEEVAHGLALDRCAKCRGLWFDRDELAAWAAKAAPASRLRIETFGDSTRTGAVRDCPRCGGRSLATHGFGWAEAAQCRSCRGVFLEPTAVDRARCIPVTPPPPNRPSSGAAASTGFASAAAEIACNLVKPSAGDAAELLIRLLIAFF